MLVLFCGATYVPAQVAGQMVSFKPSTTMHPHHHFDACDHISTSRMRPFLGGCAITTRALMTPPQTAR